MNAREFEALRPGDWIEQKRDGQMAVVIKWGNEHCRMDLCVKMQPEDLRYWISVEDCEEWTRRPHPGLRSRSEWFDPERKSGKLIAYDDQIDLHAWLERGGLDNAVSKAKLPRRDRKRMRD